MPPIRSSELAASGGLWDWDLTTNRIHFSPRWFALLGCNEHEVGNTREAWLGRVHPDDVTLVSDTLDEHLATGTGEFDIRHRMLHKDGTYRWMSCRGVVRRRADGRVERVTGCHADVTATTVADPQTGLPNRWLFLEHVTRSIGRAARYEGFHFAVLLVDLGRQVDDTRPPASLVADPLLTAAARRLETCVRSAESPRTMRHDDLVARLDGDRFGILLCGLKDLGHAMVAADRLLGELLAPFPGRHGQALLSASIGIAVSATGYASADDVLRDAATALHRATLLGGARYEVFDTAALQSSLTELQLEAEFAGALERGEFALVYQPIIAITSNQVVGFEALVRWHHPVLGVIAPLDFVPLAERSGFIVPLGRWALRRACTQLATWQRDLPWTAPVWMAVNLSNVQLGHTTLVDDVVVTLRETGVQADRLVLEVTESLALDDPAGARSVLMELRTLGVRVSIDDFGTGHSSLASLGQLPLDALKLDRSFVRGIEVRPDLCEIVAAVLVMARQLGLRAIAEGIENEAQLAAVRSLGCEHGQGYLFAKPMAPEHVALVMHDGLAINWQGRSDGPPAPGADAAASVAADRRSARPPATHFTASAAGVLLVVMVGVGAGVVGWTADVAERPGSSGARVPRSDTTSTAAAPDTSATTPTALKPVSLRVLHQHLMGNCRGRLVVSRAAVTFVPDDRERQAADVFTFRPGEFLHELGDDVLTIRSNDRTYRFKAAESTGTDSTPQLKKLVAAMARNR